LTNTFDLRKEEISASGSVVRYYKGSLMCDELKKTLGDKAFFRGAQDFFKLYRRKPAGTCDFRSFWKQRLGVQNNLLDAWLDSAGGEPKN
jgi:aminopeptidase N